MRNKQTLLACLFTLASTLVGCADGPNIFNDNLFAGGLFGGDFEFNLCAVDGAAVSTIDGDIVPEGSVTLFHGLDATEERSILAILDADGALGDITVQLDASLPEADRHTAGTLTTFGAGDCPAYSVCFNSEDPSVEPLAYTISSTNNEGVRFLILDLARGDEMFSYSIRFPATELTECIDDAAAAN